MEARMDTAELRTYVEGIIRALTLDGSFTQDNVVIWVAEDGYWVRVGHGIPHGFGWERPAALEALLHHIQPDTLESKDESPNTEV
jgi:hypothetical protein